MEAPIPISELDLPPILYKYRDHNNANHLDSLFNSKIYIPSASEFNDPLDSRTPFRYSKEELTDENLYLKALEVAKLNYPKLSEQEYQELAWNTSKENKFRDEQYMRHFDNWDFEKVCNDFGIFCVTPDCNNFLMWSYYSNSHKGFCIGYNSEKLVKERIFGFGGNMDYRKDFPKRKMFGVKDELIFLSIFYVKWNIWKHENEYRLLHLFTTGKLKKIPTDVTAEVVLGCEFPEGKKINFINMIREKLPETKISQMEITPGEFGLKKTTIWDSSMLLDF